MYRTIILKNSYKDSVELMLLTEEISLLEGVKKVSIMMATDANKSIFESSGMLTDELKKAGPNDIGIVVDLENDSVEKIMLEKIDEFLNVKDEIETPTNLSKVKTWNQALQVQRESNLALISVPGIYAAYEAHKALDKGLNVFLFSDNVSLDDEVELKNKALNKNLMVMGPDCGTGIIKGVPIAFTNNVAQGDIGLVGASGTGIQEITTLIHKQGKGISSAFGTGGRDLNKEVGGITMLQSLKALNEDDKTRVIVVLSKPSDLEVQRKINDYLITMDKPIVTLFLGEKPKYHGQNLYRAYTLAEAAKAAVMFSNNENPIENLIHDNAIDTDFRLDGKVIKGYYSGGTLASEASMLISEAVGLKKTAKDITDKNGFEVLDLGDDKYTRGKPHPMMDPGVRIDYIKKAAEDSRLGVLLFDVVIGYGSHENMSSALAPALVELMSRRPDIVCVASVCGTDLDYQDYDKQVQTLEDLGVIVCSSNQQAIMTSLKIINKPLELESIPLLEESDVTFSNDEFKVDILNQELKVDILNQELKVVNVGLKDFYDNLIEADAKAIQFDWKPIASGNLKLINALQFLDNVKEI